MGLDITAIARLTRVSCDDPDGCDHEHLYVNDDFEGRAEPFSAGCYETDDHDDGFGFRAGSYSGYNRWRALLSMLALGKSPEEVWGNYAKYAGKPFAELICFSDCEGVIGTVVSKKLAADFAAHDDRMREAMADYDYERYGMWRKAFEHASDRGAVLFH